MDTQRRSESMSGEALERSIARELVSALAVDPSPEFAARVRARVAAEPAPQSLIAALKGCATFSTWRRASLGRRSAERPKATALRWALCFAGGPVVAAAIVAAVVLMRPDGARAPLVNAPLAARTISSAPATVPYVASGFSRTSVAAGFSRTLSGPPKGGRDVRTETAPLIDTRESRALRTLIADARDGRVDLAPLLQPGAPAPMELPPVGKLSITPITIEPIAPLDGAQGVRQ